MEPCASHAPPNEHPYVTTPTRTVCVIDDEREVCDLLRLLLESRDIRCLVAHDGRTGLAMVRKHRPDAVILDVKMPEMNGHEVLVELRKDKALGATPVMMMTALTADERRTDAEWEEILGVQAFLTKPIHLDALMERLERLIPAGEDAQR